MTDDTRLYEYDREEWWDIMKRAKPDITREEFDEHWEKFSRDKAERERKKETQ